MRAGRGEAPDQEDERERTWGKEEERRVYEKDAKEDEKEDEGEVESGGASADACR